MLRLTVSATGLALAGLVVACSQDPTTPSISSSTSIAAVAPAGGAIGVDLATQVVVRFDHPMTPMMSVPASLREGDVGGPIVAGTWSWSPDGTSLTFTHGGPLASATPYVLHLGGGLRDAAGNPVNMGAAAEQMGGHWATAAVMAGHGMMAGNGEMGPGWDGAGGTYGMVFGFTTQ